MSTLPPHHPREKRLKHVRKSKRLLDSTFTSSSSSSQSLHATRAFPSRLSSYSEFDSSPSTTPPQGDSLLGAFFVVPTSLLNSKQKEVVVEDFHMESEERIPLELRERIRITLLSQGISDIIFLPRPHSSPNPPPPQLSSTLTQESQEEGEYWEIICDPKTRLGIEKKTCEEGRPLGIILAKTMREGKRWEVIERGKLEEHKRHASRSVPLEEQWTKNKTRMPKVLRIKRNQLVPFHFLTLIELSLRSNQFPLGNLKTTYDVRNEIFQITCENQKKGKKGGGGGMCGWGLKLRKRIKKGGMWKVVRVREKHTCGWIESGVQDDDEEEDELAIGTVVRQEKKEEAGLSRLVANKNFPRVILVSPALPESEDEEEEQDVEMENVPLQLEDSIVAEVPSESQQTNETQSTLQSNIFDQVTPRGDDTPGTELSPAPDPVSSESTSHELLLSGNSHDLEEEAAGAPEGSPSPIINFTSPSTPPEFPPTLSFNLDDDDEISSPPEIEKVQEKPEEKSKSPEIIADSEAEGTEPPEEEEGEEEFDTSKMSIGNILSTPFKGRHKAVEFYQDEVDHHHHDEVYESGLPLAEKLKSSNVLDDASEMEDELENDEMRMNQEADVESVERDELDDSEEEGDRTIQLATSSEVDYISLGDSEVEKDELEQDEPDVFGDVQVDELDDGEEDELEGGEVQGDELSSGEDELDEDALSEHGIRAEENNMAIEEVFDMKSYIGFPSVEEPESSSRDSNPVDPTTKNESENVDVREVEASEQEEDGEESEEETAPANGWGNSRWTKFIYQIWRETESPSSSARPGQRQARISQSDIVDSLVFADTTPEDLCDAWNNPDSKKTLLSTLEKSGKWPRNGGEERLTRIVERLPARIEEFRSIESEGNAK